MAIYTYADFEQAAKQAGLLNQFSKADLTLAQQNPDAGMSILKYKQDYLNATTDEARAAANAGAEGVRSSWGGYTGGGDGGSFHLDAMSPNDYTYGSAPEYTNRYDGTIQGLLNQVVNRPEFSYNPDTDPLASAYKKQYAREGQRATQDTLGAAAAATGGLPSSYAVSAAGQAGNYYASQMADKIPELYQLAYNKYVSDHSMKLSDLGAVQSAEQADYNKYLNQLNQYNTDRNFGYGQYLDEVNNQTLIRQENAALSDSEYQRQLELAQLAASYGDYSGLEALGVNPNYALLTSSGGKGGEEDVKKDPVEEMKIMEFFESIGKDASTAKYYASVFPTLQAAKTAYYSVYNGAIDPEPVTSNNDQLMKMLGYSSDTAAGVGARSTSYRDVLAGAQSLPKSKVKSFLADAVESELITETERQRMLTALGVG